jgi:ankyrin repeat protein
MDKRVFIRNVRTWQSAAVQAALGSDRGLASYVDKIGKTPLHHCAEIDARKFGLSVVDSLKTTRALLRAGGDANAVRIIIDDGEEFCATPLWYAVAWGKNYDLARLLLECGAQPDDNAVGSAIWDQDLRLAELLRKHGGRIDHASHGETPLLRTVKARRWKLIGWMIDHGANINFQDAKGFSVLHHAAKGAHTLAEVDQLLRYGVNPKLRTKDGSTALSLAAANRKPKLVKLLESYDAA